VCWWLGKVVPIPLERLEDEVGHRGGDLAHGGGIIPVGGDAEEAGTSPVDMRFVLGFEYTEKVFDICGVGILNPEVIDNEREGDVPSSMLEEATRLGHVVPVGLQQLDEILLSYGLLAKKKG
jgi:hypothetical protein